MIGKPVDLGRVLYEAMVFSNMIELWTSQVLESGEMIIFVFLNLYENINKQFSYNADTFVCSTPCD